MAIGNASTQDGRTNESPVLNANGLNANDKSPLTQILPVRVEELGNFSHSIENNFCQPWTLTLGDSRSAANLRAAVAELHDGSSPVAFPTETVYGLAADATSSRAVRGIYRAKQRPADNPLIVHFASVAQLRSLLDPRWDALREPDRRPAAGQTSLEDPIPSVYLPLIRRFWPGPLTILLPLPNPSPLAPEVTNSLQTFGARMPASPLALALIQQTGRPLAAPSANASTRPSPTTAQHVLEDLQGRIRLILDGGPCKVGVESTVVDGLSDPPCILRPGGVSIDDIRTCPGWEGVVNGYRSSELSHTPAKTTNGVGSTVAPQTEPDLDATPGDAPRAPGMKYRHYSPRARVILVDPAAWEKLDGLVETALRDLRKVGVIRTSAQSVAAVNGHAADKASRSSVEEIFIGPTVADVARGLFSALRELDRRGVDAIFAEGLSDEAGETAEAVMNRLRKAAGERISL